MTREKICLAGIFVFSLYFIHFPCKSSAQNQDISLQLWGQISPFIQGEAGTGFGAPDYRNAFHSGIGGGIELSKDIQGTLLKIVILSLSHEMEIPMAEIARNVGYVDQLSLRQFKRWNQRIRFIDFINVPIFPFFKKVSSSIEFLFLPNSCKSG